MTSINQYENGVIEDLSIEINKLSNGVWNYAVRDRNTGIGYIGVAASAKEALLAAEARVVEYEHMGGLY